MGDVACARVTESNNACSGHDCVRYRPATAHCAVHCLGSLFMDTIHKHCSWTLFKKKVQK